MRGIHDGEFLDTEKTYMQWKLEGIFVEIFQMWKLSREGFQIEYQCQDDDSVTCVYKKFTNIHSLASTHTSSQNLETLDIVSHPCTKCASDRIKLLQASSIDEMYKCKNFLRDCDQFVQYT